MNYSRARLEFKREIRFAKRSFYRENELFSLKIAWKKFRHSCADQTSKGISGVKDQNGLKTDD